MDDQHLFLTLFLGCNGQRVLIVQVPPHRKSRVLGLAILLNPVGLARHVLQSFPQTVHLNVQEVVHVL